MTLTMFTLNAFYGLALAMNMFIIASGLNLIFGVLRVINFAHGMFYMFGAYITFTVAKTWGAPFFVGVLASAAALAAIAFVIERLLLRRLYDKEHLMQLLFTFALVRLIDGTVRYRVWGDPSGRAAWERVMSGRGWSDDVAPAA
jgi:branched-subunit amino acid ABC-type transport system permease component